MVKSSLWRKRQIQQVTTVCKPIVETAIDVFIASVSTCTFALVYTILRHSSVPEFLCFLVALVWSCYPIGASVWRQMFPAFYIRVPY